jgi:hypothetical protein
MTQVEEWLVRTLNLFLLLFPLLSLVECLRLTPFSFSLWILCWICWYECSSLLGYHDETILRRALGAALAVKTWAWQLTHPKNEPLPGEKPFANEKLLIESVKETLEAGKKKSGRSPKVLVIGAVSHPSETESQTASATDEAAAWTMWQGRGATGQGRWYSRKRHYAMGSGGDQER